MASLIDESTKWWNVEKVRRLLPKREANDVLNIMLNTEFISDYLVWEHERSGVFTVKSAYKFFLSMTHDRQIVESSSAEL